TKFLVK
ncbi:glycosyl transferase family, helical bundle domain protein, partial [Vibrio parahaemolyticus AQ3810]